MTYGLLAAALYYLGKCLVVQKHDVQCILPVGSSELAVSMQQQTYSFCRVAGS